MALVLRIPPSPSSWDKKAFVYPQTPLAHFHLTRIAPAGRAYYQYVNGGAQVDASPTIAKSPSLDFEDEKYAKLKDLNSVDLNDYYGLLGLQDKTFSATEQEIRAAYRVLQKVCHPDKFLPSERDRAEERFKAMQLGYETLVDQTRRRGYDSSLPFNDAIPGPKQGLTEADFFKVYGPVFERNERFSVKRPVPRLGDLQSSNEEVNDFYSFWTTFESWREFAHLNEAKPENAGSREEKRSMERENKKKQVQKKKEEMRRIYQLAEDAMKKDPRIARMRREAEAEKLARKQAKIDAQLAAEAEKNRAAEEARRAAEAAAKAEADERAQKKNLKQAMKSARSYFAKFAKGVGFDEEIVQKLRETLSLEQFEPIIAEFKADPQSAKGKQMVQKIIDQTNNASENGTTETKEPSAEQIAEQKYQEMKAAEAREAAKASA